MDERRRPEMHEAGHVVVSLELRTGVLSVDTRPSKRDHGRTRYPLDQGTSRYRTFTERRIVVRLAGDWAVWIAERRPARGPARSSDYTRAVLSAYQLDHEHVYALVADLDARAIRILEARWSDVEVVAAELRTGPINRRRLLALTSSATG